MRAERRGFLFWPTAAGRPARLLGRSILALVLPILTLVPLILVRCEVQHRYGFTRDLDDIRRFAATRRTYLAVPPIDHLWHGIFPEAYPGPLFPGVITSALALRGTPFALRRWPHQAGYALLLTLIGGILSPGPEVAIGGWVVGLTYGWLYARVPGASAMRDPDRLDTLALLGLPLLAGLGVAALSEALRPLIPTRLAPALGVALAIVSGFALAEFRSGVPGILVLRDPVTVAVYDWLRD